MSDIVERLRDLHRQATLERSHYYVGMCALDAIFEIDRYAGLLEALKAIRDDKTASYGVTALASAAIKRATVDAARDGTNPSADLEHLSSERRRGLEEALAFLNECYAILTTTLPQNDWSKLKAFLDRSAPEAN